MKHVFSSILSRSSLDVLDPNAGPNASATHDCLSVGWLQVLPMGNKQFEVMNCSREARIGQARRKEPLGRSRLEALRHQPDLGAEGLLGGEPEAGGAVGR